MQYTQHLSLPAVSTTAVLSSEVDRLLPTALTNRPTLECEKNV